MTSTVPDEAASTRPWGGSLAMAGAMAAGLAAGCNAKPLLAAGITAAVGLKWVLRRGTAERSQSGRAASKLECMGAGQVSEA